jgi:hypothetical protein
VSYGVVQGDQTIDVMIRWDHRITDAAPIARVLTRLEQVLNTEIAARIARRRLAAGRAKAVAGGGEVRHRHSRWCVGSSAPE